MDWLLGDDMSYFVELEERMMHDEDFVSHLVILPWLEINRLVNCHAVSAKTASMQNTTMTISENINWQPP